MNVDVTNEWNHTLEDEVVCPYCGYVHTESYEFFDDMEGDEDIECIDCGEEFRVSRIVTIQYTSRKRSDGL
jgi:DNA-directed RNA polymerase subunit RPC12/RpoP